VLKTASREEIGYRIRVARVRIKLTQEELGERLELWQGAISQWERGRIPSFDYWDRLCDALGVSFIELFFDEVEEPAAQRKATKRKLPPLERRKGDRRTTG
jgi:transcriptional regulator with XRE-family HTH domain